MTGLPGNLGTTNIAELVALLKNARDTGRSVLQAAVEALASNPQLKGIVDQLRGLLGKSVIELTDAELDDLISERHAGNQAKSKPWVDDEPTPAPTPTPAAFPYFTILGTDPHSDPRLSGNYKIYQSLAAPGTFYVTDGLIGGGRREPDANSPLVTVNGEEVGGDWQLMPR